MTPISMKLVHNNGNVQRSLLMGIMANGSQEISTTDIIRLLTKTYPEHRHTLLTARSRVNPIQSGAEIELDGSYTRRDDTKEGRSDAPLRDAKRRATALRNGPTFPCGRFLERELHISSLLPLLNIPHRLLLRRKDALVPIADLATKQRHRSTAGDPGL
ncbi:hypothetical protein PQX77_006657 [Marasmius sp. AFHP31]|nr:hypothetical protein PQX77_006657 [Marasmius sp. AFHP31]